MPSEIPAASKRISSKKLWSIGATYDLENSLSHALLSLFRQHPTGYVRDTSRIDRFNRLKNQARNIVGSYLTRVLVAYSTRFGSTREVASAIVRELNSTGLEAQSAETTSALNPDEYDAFVIGSPLYGGKWLAAAGMFAATTSERISSKPVALFSIGTLGVESKQTGDTQHREFIKQLAEIAPALNIVGDAMFTGYFERANLPWYLRIIDRFSPTRYGDHRDWQAIKAWAKSLALKFTAK